MRDQAGIRVVTKVVRWEGRFGWSGRGMQEGPGWLYGRPDRYADHLQGGDAGAHAGHLAGQVDRQVL